MNEEGPKEAKTQYYNLVPLTKGKHVLLFLADYFISFIFSLLVFCLIGFPITHAAIGYGQMLTDEITWNLEACDALYDNKVLYVETEGSKGNLSVSLEYTCKEFAFYSIGPSEEKADTLNPFYHYFKTLRGYTQEEAQACYFKVSSGEEYFTHDTDIGGMPALKDQYKIEFAPLFSSSDSPSAQGEADYESFSEDFFLPFYKEMLEEISSYDYENQTDLYGYQEAIGKIDASEAKRYSCVSYTALACYVFSWAICFLLIPLVSKRGKTLGQMILKKTRVSQESFHLVPKSLRPSVYLFDLFLDLSFLFLLPATVLSFENIFSVPYLLVFSIMGLCLDLVFLFVLIFSSYSQSLRDMASRSVIVNDEDLETVYELKGEIL